MLVAAPGEGFARLFMQQPASEMLEQATAPGMIRLTMMHDTSGTVQRTAD